MQGIHLQLEDQDTKETFELVTVDADDEYAFEVSVQVPDVPAGRYEIVDARGAGYFVGKALLVVAAD